MPAPRPRHARATPSQKMAYSPRHARATVLFPLGSSLRMTRLVVGTRAPSRFEHLHCRLWKKRATFISPYALYQAQTALRRPRDLGHVRNSERSVAGGRDAERDQAQHCVHPALRLSGKLAHLPIKPQRVQGVVNPPQRAKPSRRSNAAGRMLGRSTIAQGQYSTRAQSPKDNTRHVHNRQCLLVWYAIPKGGWSTGTQLPRPHARLTIPKYQSGGGMQTWRMVCLVFSIRHPAFSSPNVQRMVW
eukprot:gene2982-biopygen11171